MGGINSFTFNEKQISLVHRIMNVLIYSAYSFGTRLFETQLELMKNEMDEGNVLHVLKCGRVLEACMFNKRHDLLKCAKCQSRAYNGLSKIGVPKENIHDLQHFDEAYKVAIPHFSKLEELLEYEFEGIKIGRGVASSMITQTRDFELDSEKYGARIETNIRMSINVYLNFKHYLSELKIDKIITFNGRFAEQRPVIEIAEQMGIEYIVHERGGTLSKYILYQNSTPFDFEYNYREINRYWQEADPEYRQSKAEEWYNQRRNGTPQNWYVYINDQEKNALPEGFDPNKRNIVIFNTSEDECKALEGWENPYFDDQNAGVAYLAEQFANDPNVHFYLRVHPNLGKVDNSQVRGIAALNYPNLTVLPPHSEVDSYALMDTCAVTITFGSTMGIEATYWEKPSILAGQSTYKTLGSVYIPDSAAHLIEMIKTLNEPMPKLGALQYSFWNAVKGIDFKYYEPVSVNNGKFMGEFLGYERHLEEYLQEKERKNKGLKGRISRGLKRVLGTEKTLTENGFYEKKYDELYRKAKEDYV